MRELELVTRDPTKISNPDWLWKNKIVKGSVNLIFGEEKVGKSTLVVWMLAQMARGKLPGAYQGRPIRCAIVGNEDSWDKVWNARLEALNAPPDRVQLLRVKNDFGSIDIVKDLARIVRAVKLFNIKAFYFDQLLDSMGVADHYNQKEVRRQLNPIHRAAEKYGFTVIATMHTNKAGESFRQKANGSPAFMAVARSCLYVGYHPEDEHARVVTTAATNYGIRGDTKEFSLVTENMRPNGRLVTVSRVATLMNSDLTVDEVLGNKLPKRLPNQQVDRLLKLMLRDGNWHSSSDVIEELVERGFSKRTVQRTAKDIVEHQRESSFHAGTLWRLANSPHATKGGSNHRSRSVDKKSTVRDN